MGGRKLLGSALIAGLLLLMTVQAVAQNQTVLDAKRDLAGISPHRHHYLFAVIGGTAIGAGLGALVGGSGNIGKGILMGGGGMSALYLHSHRNAAGPLRDWAFIGSHAAFGTGIGWTICGCDNGALAGGLVGGGASAAWRALEPDRGLTTVARQVKQAPHKAKKEVDKISH